MLVSMKCITLQSATRCENRELRALSPSRGLGPFGGSKVAHYRVVAALYSIGRKVFHQPKNITCDPSVHPSVGSSIISHPLFDSPCNIVYIIKFGNR